VLNAIPATAGAISLTSATYLSGILPVANGGTGLSAGGPAFSAFANTTQSISAATWTKVTLGSEEFDTANAFDSTTNYRFQPTIAGYYYVNASWLINSGGSSYTGTAFYKNGNQFKVVYTTNTLGLSSTLTSLVYLNGSTDYLEMYAYSSGNSNTIYGSSTPSLTLFQASLARAS
jgi:hypothetical protein